MNENELITWLFDNGGSAIRYRTATELMENCSAGLKKQLIKDLLEHKKAKALLPLLDGFPTIPSFNNIRDFIRYHSSKGHDLEQILPKLMNIGFKKGISEFDKKMRNFCKYVENDLVRKAQQDPQDVTDTWAIWTAHFVAAHFVWGGYTYKESIDYIKKRIDLLYKAASLKLFDIHSEKGKKPIIKPELDPCIGDTPLPIIFDIFCLSYFPQENLNKDYRKKINVIIEYILDDRFQSLPEGYGYLSYISSSGKRTVYGCGWSPVLPGFFSFDSQPQLKSIILYLDLMSHFKVAIKSNWFKNCMDHLEQYRNNSGTYSFPSNYLSDKKDGFFVLGNGIGLEESRSKKSLELESTFWMLLIKRRIRNMV